LDRRLRARLDASDVVQEACIEATERFDEFRTQSEMPFYLWLRFLTLQKLLVQHRHHLGTKARDAGRDVFLGGNAGASSADLAARLVGRLSTPSRAAMRAELKQRIRDVLDRMDPTDREVLVLRHFEQLSNGETAKVLGLRESTTSMRYARALLRLKDILAADQH
jgi:RNA polymerase sigma-70 factor (ECF subfamily)